MDRDVLRLLLSGRFVASGCGTDGGRRPSRGAEADDGQRLGGTRHFCRRHLRVSLQDELARSLLEKEKRQKVALRNLTSSRPTF